MIYLKIFLTATLVGGLGVILVEFEDNADTPHPFVAYLGLSLLTGAVIIGFVSVLFAVWSL